MLAKELKSLGFCFTSLSGIIYLLGFMYYVWILQHDSTVTARLADVQRHETMGYVFVLEDAKFKEPIVVPVDANQVPNYKLGDRITFTRNVNPWGLSEDTRLPRYAPEHQYNLMQEILRWVAPTLKYFVVFFGVLGWSFWGAGYSVRFVKRIHVYHQSLVLRRLK